MSRSIWRLPEVMRRTGLPRSTLYRQIQDGAFPRPVQLSERSVGCFPMQWTSGLTRAAHHRQARRECSHDLARPHQTITAGRCRAHDWRCKSEPQSSPAAARGRRSTDFKYEGQHAIAQRMFLAGASPTEISRQTGMHRSSVANAIWRLGDAEQLLGFQRHLAVLAGTHGLGFRSDEEMAALLKPLQCRK